MSNFNYTKNTIELFAVKFKSVTASALICKGQVTIIVTAHHVTITKSYVGLLALTA